MERNDYITMTNHKYMQLLKKLYCFYNEKLQNILAVKINNKFYIIVKKENQKIYIRERESKIIKIIEISDFIAELIDADSIEFF